MPQSHRAAERFSVGSVASSPTCLAYALLLAVLAALFGSSLAGIDRLAFRDCSHFYTPLYGYLAAQERQQWLPLHNPLDVTGIALAGETTTALFYPLRRIVYYLAASAEAALAWYVVLHLLLAGVTVHFAARSAGATSRGCALAILAYPLSGPVLFLYCNPPFLVGAAWVPLALAGGARLIRRMHIRDLAITSVGLAMPVLGGDPQVSIHVMLIGLVVAVSGGLAVAMSGCFSCITSVWTPRVAKADSADAGVHPAQVRAILGRTWFVSASQASAVFLRLTAAVLLAMLLATPQIAASLDWARQSVRYAPASQLPLGEAYRFSVAPWHWLELVAPALSGSLFPIYTRISHLIPGDGQTWTLTLYAGLIPLALGVARYRCTSWRKLDLWDCLLPIGLAFALGSFGVGYLLKIFLPFLNLHLEDAVGGPYWWLATFMPGYSGFRYPAKWLVFVPLGIAVAAARQASRAGPQDDRVLAQTLFSLATVALSVSALVVIALQVTAQRSPQLLRLSDAFWGPLQWHQAASLVAVSALLGVSVAAAAFWICRTPHRPRAVTAGLLVLVAIDLSFVAWPTIATVNRAAEAQWMAAAPTADHSSAHSGDERHQRARYSDTAGPPAGQRALRFIPGEAWPPQWGSTPSPGQERLLAVEASMRNSLYGRWHLEHEQAVFNPVTSLPPHRSRSFWQAANGLARAQENALQPTRFWDRIMGWLAIDQAWLVTTADSAGVDANRADSGRPADEILTLEIAPTLSPSPNVLWSPAWQVVPERNWIAPQAFAKRLAALTGDDLSLSSIPLIESNDLAQDRRGSANTNLPAPPQPLQASAQITDHSSSGVRRIMVDAPAAGLVCIKQFQDGNWRATLRILSPGSPGQPSASAMTTASTSRATKIYRCDYLFSAVMVPAGLSEIVLAYEPAWLYPSLALAALGWSATLVLVVIAYPKSQASSQRFHGH